jgi:hypothetical protein
MNHQVLLAPHADKEQSSLLYVDMMWSLTRCPALISHLQLTVKTKIYNSYGTMKLFIAVAVLSILSKGVKAAPAETCAQQDDCLSWTLDRIQPNSPPLCGMACEFKVCMKFTAGGTCGIAAGGSISHLCDGAGINDDCGDD